MKTKSAGQFAFACIVLLLCVVALGAADQRTVGATLQSPTVRKLAPAFSLLDASGKAVRLSDFRGKVVLLDFWATDCGGCRIEIPWYIELQRTFEKNNFVVVGVSMDIQYENLRDAKEAWSRVNPFVRDNKVNYPILMGDDLVTNAYEVKALPATYLIDEKGRIATTYVGVLADKNNIDANIKILLTER